MFHFKNNFLKVLLLNIIGFLFICAEDELGYHETVTRCKDRIYSTFDEPTSTILCIKNAIRSHKLYGEQKFIYDDDALSYYQMFHFRTNPDQVNLPREFCEIITSNFKLDKELNRNLLEAICAQNLQRCINELSIFEEPFIVEEGLLPILSEEDLELLEGVFNFPSSNSTVQNKVANAGTDSFSTETSSERNMKFNIVKNALYYHVKDDPPSGYVRTEETIKYFHAFETYGYFYLDHIAEVVNLVDGEVPSPWAFCVNKYQYLKKRSKTGEKNPVS